MHHLGNPLPHTTQALLKQLKEKIRSIDWELAKKDVRGFVPDPRVIDPWSADFFLSLIDHLKFE
jgi:hypothetical protein